MTTKHLVVVAVDIAQCATCGGVLVPAGDDWRHDDVGHGCTELATPVICRYDDCGMPAAIGSLACLGQHEPLRALRV